MEMGMLVYKRQKGTITAEDYIAWSHTILVQGNESPSIRMISAFTPGANLFEIETYFQRALHEMGLVIPIIEPNSRATIALLANEIMREHEEAQLAQLANDIFHIVAELNYPEDLIGWYDISEMQDRLIYDTLPLPFGKEEISHKIKEEARRVLSNGGKQMKYTCPCCGYKTLDEKPPGTYEICSICYWEDDPVQFDDPDYEGGANTPSLRTAQNNYRLFGACEECYKKYVCEPNGQYEKDAEWRPFK